MDTYLSSREAAERLGIVPSTFRAYVARGQAPQAARTEHGVKVWSLHELEQWNGRKLDLPASSGLTQVKAARLHSRGRIFRESLHDDLAQLGLSWHEADSLIDNVSVDGMDLAAYRDARRIVRLHEQMRARLDPDRAPVHDHADTDSLVMAAAARIADGTADPFAARNELAVELTDRGYGELLFPRQFDPEFWTVMESGDTCAIGTYLLECERAEVPVVQSTMTQARAS